MACAEMIDVPAADYERIRSDSLLFIIVPGHEIADIEDVVEGHETFEVVRKREGEPGRVARATDPRD